MLQLIGLILFAGMISTIYSALVLSVFVAGIVCMYALFPFWGSEFDKIFGFQIHFFSTWMIFPLALGALWAAHEVSLPSRPRWLFITLWTAFWSTALMNSSISIS